jgi:hypothetical protein
MQFYLLNCNLANLRKKMRFGIVCMLNFSELSATIEEKYSCFLGCQKCVLLCHSSFIKRDYLTKEC